MKCGAATHQAGCCGLGQGSIKRVWGSVSSSCASHMPSTYVRVSQLCVLTGHLASLVDLEVPAGSYSRVFMEEGGSSNGFGAGLH